VNTETHSRPSLRAAVQLLTEASLPTADLTESHLEHFFYCGPAASPTGLIGLEIHGDAALLRSLVVAKPARSAGLGAKLVSHAEQYARSRGVTAVYLLTTTAQEFFERLGYANSERTAAPLSIQSTREFADICPASSAFMIKLL
jgi:amino-acid N-acetyltransferase